MSLRIRYHSSIDPQERPTLAPYVPDELIDFDHRRMQCYGNRCSALAGEIGSRAQCSVYANRPLVCREFQPGSEDCVMVRRRFELPAA